MVTAPDAVEFCVETRLEESAAVVSVAGEVDATNAHRLHAAITAAIDGGTLVVVDLTAVPFLDSTGLGTLVRGLKHAAVRGTTLRLVVTDPHLQNVLTITGLHNVVGIYQDRHAAVSRQNS